MIKLLESQNTAEVADRFAAEKFQLTLTERDSTCTITVGPTAPEINVGAWLQDEDEPGAGIVWRVRSVQTDYKTQTRTIQCEHAIMALKDFLLFGEVTPAVITGLENAEACTADETFRYILSKQSIWRFGSVLYNDTQAYNFNGDDLYTAMETITATIPNAWWSYDFSRVPYVISIVEKPESYIGQLSELRMDRNMKSLSVTVDRSRMYTRFYPIGRNNLMLPELYVGRNENLYGISSQTETDENRTTEADLRKWANERLDNHAEPQVTVSVNAMDLSAITGEDLDNFVLGAHCTVALPEYNTTIYERITTLQWPDKVRDPMGVTITMANQKQDLTKILSKEKKKTSTGRRSSAVSVSKSLKDVTLSGPTNNIYTLTKVLTNGKTKQIGTFSRAVTGWGVTAPGVNGTIRVTAYPQDQSKDVKLQAVNDTEWTGNVKGGKVQFSSDDGANWANSGLTYSIDATARYNQGKIDAVVAGSWGSTGTFEAYNTSNTDHKVTAAIFDPVAADITYDGTTYLNVKLYSSINGSETKTATNRTLPVPVAKVRPLITTVWGETGTLTITTNPASSSASTVAIFDPVVADTSYDGTTLNVTLYASMNGEETKTATNRTLPVPVSKIKPLITTTWESTGYLSITTSPASASASTVAIFDPVVADTSYDGTTLNVTLYASMNGAETKTATNRTLPVPVSKIKPLITTAWANTGYLNITTSPASASASTVAIFDPVVADTSYDGTYLNVTLYASMNGAETKTATNRTLPVPVTKIRPLITPTWESNGSLSITTNPSPASASTVAIFDPVANDITYDGTYLNVALYASMNGSETKTVTHRTLPVPVAKVRPLISTNWTSSGTLQIYTNPAPSSGTTVAIFDPVSSDVSVSNNTINVHLYASVNGSETKTDTNRVIPIPTSFVHPLLSGSWSNGTLTVTSNPASSSALTYSIFDTTSADVTWTGNTGVITVYVNQNGGETKIDTGKRLTVTANVHPTIAGSWSNGTLTITTTPSAAANKTFGIFDTTNADVSWNGVTATIAVYVNQDGGETKIDTGKRLMVNAPFTRYTFKKAYGTNDQPYRGAIYDSRGNQLSSENYYWYGYNENFSSTVNTYLWRQN